MESDRIVKLEEELKFIKCELESLSSKVNMKANREEVLSLLNKGGNRIETQGLVGLTEEWFIKYGLDKEDPSKQMLKLYEEYGELCEAIADNDKDMIHDAIGDMMVVITGLSLQLGVDNPIKNEVGDSKIDDIFLNMNSFLGELSSSIAKSKSKHISEDYLNMIYTTLYDLANTFSNKSCQECLGIAYNVIKDRKLKMVNGVLVKEEDLDESIN